MAGRFHHMDVTGEVPRHAKSVVCCIGIDAHHDLIRKTGLADGFQQRAKRLDPFLGRTRTLTVGEYPDLLEELSNNIAGVASRLRSLVYCRWAALARRCQHPLI